MLKIDNLDVYDVIIAWGAGQNFKDLYRNQFRIDYLVDQDGKKVGNVIHGKTVSLMIDDLVKDKNTLFVVSSSDYYYEIHECIRGNYPSADIISLRDLIMLYGGERNYYCLWGIDAIVNDILMRAGYSYPDIKYIEVGANHPLHGSATMSMYMKGSEGMLIEPNPELIPSLVEMRPRDKVLNCGVGSEESSMTFYRLDNSYRSSFDPETVKKNVELGFSIVDKIDVPIKTLDSIFEKMPTEWSKSCYVSVATMGFEDRVLRGFDHMKWAPPIVSVGYSSDRVLEEKIFKDYRIIAEVPKHKILVTQEIYRIIMG